jgi:hypothetical protein
VAWLILVVMNLPENIETIARSFPGLAVKRKQELIGLLAVIPEGARGYGIDNVINRCTPKEAAFVLHVLGKDAPDQGASPDNKMLGAPMTK